MLILYNICQTLCDYDQSSCVSALGTLLQLSLAEKGDGYIINGLPNQKPEKKRTPLVSTHTQHDMTMTTNE